MPVRHPLLTRQGKHLAAYTSMAELCEQRGDLERAKQYRNMAKVAAESNWAAGKVTSRVAMRNRNAKGNK